MLVLSRRLNQRILLPSINTAIQIVSSNPGVVRVGIEAPQSVPVFREEIFDPQKWQAEVRGHADAEPARLRHLMRNLLQASTLGAALLRRQLRAGRTADMEATLDRMEQEVRTLEGRLAETPPPTPPPPAGRACRALVVEDNSNECELLAGFLRLAGLEVDTANDGSAALNYLQERGKPDVVLLDLMMPQVGGLATVQAIRRDPRWQGLKIYIVSGAERDRFQIDRGPDGVDGWFCKPINPEVLLRELSQDLAQPA